MSGYNDTKQHTYGSGEISFAAFAAGTQVPGAFRYFGNTTDFTLSTEVEKLEHFDSDHGVRVKDASVVTSTTMSGSIATDNMNKENMALLLLGTSSTLSQTSATGATDTITAIQFGTYIMGVTPSRPQGYRKIASVVVKNASGGPTTYVAGVDYVVDLEAGTVTFIEGGTIAAGNPAWIQYNVTAYQMDQIISGNSTIDGALRFKSTNPIGPKWDLLLPYVSLTPDGDVAFKGEDWLSIPFSMDVQQKGSLARVYASGVPI